MKNNILNKNVLILANSGIVVFNFRRELVEELISSGYKVYISTPNDSRAKILEDMGCEIIDTPISRHGTNILEDIKLLVFYKRIIRTVNPRVVLTFTIKPNIYGGLSSSLNKVPYIVNITGLGTALENPGPLQKLIILLYHFALQNVQTVFFQNTENEKFFMNNKLAMKKNKLLPGSGVNLNYFKLLPYPNTKVIEFLYSARLMKEKGIEEYLAAAKYIKNKYPNMIFHVCGFCEEGYHGQINEYQDQNIIYYHGLVDDLRPILKRIECTILPTYYPEGMSNALLESCASGRAIITTNRSGCREIIDDGLNGFICQEKNVEDLINQIEKFINLNRDQRMQFGLNARKKVEKQFDRNIVVQAYMDAIEKANT